MQVDIVSQRLRNQYLVGTKLESPEEAVRWFGAVQAQDFPGAKWALGQRVAHTTNSDIDSIFNNGVILRTHVMRPTWHFVHRTDIRWLLELTAHRVHAANSYPYRKFGLDGGIREKSETLIAESLLNGGELTRKEIGQVLNGSGIEADGLRLGYILMNAELNGVVCSGALRGKQHTYALLDERVPRTKSWSRCRALTELAKRYFASRNPAQLQDFAWWSGLTLTDARAAAEGARLAEFEQQGRRYWGHTATSPKKTDVSIHLLPNYDEYFIAYKDRSAYETQFSIAPPTGIFDRHILVVNGKLAGAWRAATHGKTLVMSVTPLVPMRPKHEEALDKAAEGYGRFLARPVEVELP